MSQTEIIVRGAREHNLQNVDLVLPRNKLIAMTGVSGSGKSSLAFDTLYAEGQRRYVESLSSYARQFLGQMPKPDVDSISGLAPSISIQQKTSSRNPRSTVGTITEIYDYLRVLFARVGTGYCYNCGQPITAQSLDQILESVFSMPKGVRYSILVPLITRQKGEYRDLFEDLQKQGFVRARVDGRVVSLSDDLSLDRQMKHTIEVVIDRLESGKASRSRVSEAVELALKLGGGNLIIHEATDEQASVAQDADNEIDSSANDRLFSAHYACVRCGISFDPPSPQLFSFNSPQGMCLDCNGLGERHDFVFERLIPSEKKSLRNGAIEPLGTLKSMGRWRKHIYQGVFEAIEKDLELTAGSIAKTPWKDLTDETREKLLYGTGDRNITFTYGHSGGAWKHGGTFAGIIPELLDDYRKSRNPMRRKQLEKYMEFVHCHTCSGSRLNPQARSVRLTGRAENYTQHGLPDALSLPEVCGLTIEEAYDFFEEVDLDATSRTIAEEALKEIRGRLGFLLRCGLDYLTLDRTAPTLSGGEMQRIRLAGQIGCGLVGVLYILDEPSIGLHPRDNDMLLDSLRDLRDQGNTVLIVEHDEDTMRVADHIVDFGPGPGVRGGEVVAEGSLTKVLKSKRSLTGQYLSGRLKIEVPETRRPTEQGHIEIKGARHNNLKGVDAKFPIGSFICVTGVSGSGKSSLVNDILWQILNRDINGGNGSPGEHGTVAGLDLVDKAIDIDQSPIGRTPRSNPATYVKVFDLIRTLYTQLPESKVRGYKAGRFSFNVASGRCDACEGHGSNKLEMDFLADVWVTCPVCGGNRFNHETLEIRFKGASIADVLDMDVQQALTHFENHPKVHRMLKTLHDVGLDYVKLGQPSPTLSGGEAQRIKLARELGKRSTGKTFYLLDEPTTGLHFADIHKLLEVLHGFVEQGNTVLVVEHNIDVIKTADWVIDLGPEGGKGGGTIVAEGTPEEIARNERSHTGAALRVALGMDDTSTAVSRSSASMNGRAKRKRKAAEKSIVIRGASQHNLQSVDVTLPRQKMSVFCGPSGSGKTSLAMETLYAEGQRRYVESLSAYARQFLGQMPKPKVEHVHGLSPAIAIEQKTVGSTPRSTVGTVTEVYDYLRILFTRLGTPYCPDCRTPIETQSIDQVIARIMTRFDGERAILLAPLEVQVGQSYDTLWERLTAQGYARVRIDGQTHRLDAVPKIDRRRKHEVEIVVDRLAIERKSASRIAESVENAFDLGKGICRIAISGDNAEPDWVTERYSLHLACGNCHRSFERLTPHHFSFNSPIGWCDACEGLGVEQGRRGQRDNQIANPKKTLRQGAISVWPDLKTNVAFARMVEVMAKDLGFSLEKPFGDLPAKTQRELLQGTGDRTFTLPRFDGKTGVAGTFRYKGVVPSLEEASRVSYTHRQKLRDQLEQVSCSACEGSRLRDDAAAVRLFGKTLHEVCEMPLRESFEFLSSLEFSDADRHVAGDLLDEASSRLRFLVEVGLHYLSLSRPLPTLSGGESQRIRLAGQIGRALTGVLYVLDEPTIGLHPRDNGRLIDALHRLRDLGNTLVLVEHDREVLEASDRLYDFGPGAGRLGGVVVGEGTPKQLGKRSSLTGQFLSDRKTIPIPTTRRITTSDDSPPGGGWLELLGARHHNLRDVDLRIPLGTFTCVTGVSGSGKSSLVDETLSRAIAKKLQRSGDAPGPFDTLTGIEQINKLIVVDQQPLGSTPASNPATYTGVFDQIRELFARLPEAKVRGYRPGRFSFNRPGGRCEACEGNGQLCIEMHFLPDVWVACDVCGGRRYNSETLAVTYRGKSIADVLAMSIGEANELFDNIPKIRSYLSVLCAIGLDYLTLGQAAPTLSGGEAQRVKLAAELARPNTGKTLYLLDEPTTGLHFDDITKLLKVLNSLIEAGNTVVVIEHNLDVIKTADWVIDLGPEAGRYGGNIVAEGTPETLIEQYHSTHGTGFTSHTAAALVPLLESGKREDREIYDTKAANKKRSGDVSLTQVGRDAKMPWEKSGRDWHTGPHLGHKGTPVRWETATLARVIEQIESHDGFAAVNWNHRSIVEVQSESKEGGWFLHAMTAEQWLLKLKFRVRRETFKQAELDEQLELKSLDDLDEIPVYNRGDRVRVLNPKGPWQEVILSIHYDRELDTDAFRSFLDDAMESYLKQVSTTKIDPETVMPWAKLGRKWHLTRKGFPSDKRVAWTIETLQMLFDLLDETLPDAEVDASNKSVVHYRPAGGGDPILTLHTKRRTAIDLTFPAEAGTVTMGRIIDLGHMREVGVASKGVEQIKLRFRTKAQVSSPALKEFLRETFSAAVNN